MSAFTVLIPIDGSKNSENAFDCKYENEFINNSNALCSLKFSRKLPLSCEMFVSAQFATL
jgi:hypothetical protein